MMHITPKSSIAAPPNGPDPHHATMAAAKTADAQYFPPGVLPKVLTLSASAQPILITQGAEGRLFKTTFLHPNLPCALKYRPSKPYRHPILDARLTRARILAEARVLARCRRDGVRVPAVYAVDEAAGWIMMEWIEGIPVRKGINDWLGERPKNDVVPTDASAETAALAGLMRRVGTAVGTLHQCGIIHGDLTTSNMMLRPCDENPTSQSSSPKDALLDGEIVLLDFGLASSGTSEEDRAVDLYVLERAVESTHPRAEGLFTELLQAYGQAYKQAGCVLKKLEDVRQRGRKRSMLG